MRARRITAFLVLLASATCALVAIGAAPASAGFTTYTDATISQPVGMDEAPDGSLWFANYGNNSIGRIDPITEVITSFTDPNINGPRSVTVAPDGVVWFTSTENGRLGKIDGGLVTTYPAMEQIDDVEVAADGDIWFNGFPSVGNQRIGRFEPGPEDLFTYPANGQVLRMTPHPTDGMWFVWFRDEAPGPGPLVPRIGRINEAGTKTAFSTGTIEDPSDITTGPGNILYFTGEDDHRVGRLNPTTGVTASFGLAPELISPNEIILGPGNDLWFTIRAGGRFGRLDPATGTIVTYRDPTDTVEGPIGLAVGGDGNLWYTRAIDTVGRLELGTCAGREVTVDLALGSRPTAAADVILGRPTADTIRAGAGNDVVCAQGGPDAVYGGPGSDIVELGPGDDDALAEGGNDRVLGGAGDDIISLGDGSDRGFGDADDDVLVGGAGPDACHGGMGLDSAATCETVTGVP